MQAHAARISLHHFMERPVNDFKLLFPCQFDEVYRISRYTDRQLRIFFRMIHRIQQCFAMQDVDV